MKKLSNKYNRSNLLATEQHVHNWKEILGEDLRQQLIDEAHRDIPAVKLELKELNIRYHKNHKEPYARERLVKKAGAGS